MPSKLSQKLLLKTGWINKESYINTAWPSKRIQNKQVV